MGQRTEAGAGPIAGRRAAVAASFVAIWLAGACRDPTTPHGASSQVAITGIARELVLKIGDEAEIGPNGASITFEAVPTDSRCAVDVQCVWEGVATVVLRIEEPGSAPRVDSLRTNLPEDRVAVAGATIRLDGLAPEPHSEREISPAEYVVRLRVDEVP